MNDASLEAPLNEIQQDRIADFCQTVISRHSEQWPLDENTLAEEFLVFFGLGSLLTFDGIAQLCQDRLRIMVSFASMPTGMRGYNGSYRDKREVLISLSQDFAGAKLHTLLHELREILESGFEKLGRPIANRKDSDLEQCAESFAISVQVCAAYKIFPIFRVSGAKPSARKCRIRLRQAKYTIWFSGTSAVRSK